MRDLSVTALERILERRRKQLEALTRRRDALRKQLEKIEEQIRQIGGDGGQAGARRKGRRRPRNEKPLAIVVGEILKKSKPGLSLGQLTAKIVASGYKSYSEDFKNVVYQSLYNNRKTIIHDEKAGVYKLR
jgi:hypothetical protein